MTTTPSDGHGVIVLAAYRPNPELFAVQLQSIRHQSRGDFRCLVGADGGQEEVRRLVEETVGDDPRFEVVGWDDNLGFYLNFERLLALVPEDVAWVALSDQDDRWHPDKLGRLVPLLDRTSLATAPGARRQLARRAGRARAHRRAGSSRPRTCSSRTRSPGACHGVPPRACSTSRCPFPRWHTVTQLHDHWLALCAVALDGYEVLDDVVQDYVQHGTNLVGEIVRPAWYASGASSCRCGSTGGRRTRAATVSVGCWVPANGSASVGGGRCSGA